MNVLLIGPPGSGKGTQGQVLADRLGLRHIADRLEYYAGQTGDETLRPAALLQRLADKNEGFGGPPREKAA